MEWRYSNGFPDFRFPGIWCSSANSVCHCINRQGLEVEEKVILRELMTVANPTTSC